LTREEKLRILRALEEDVEFRYAVAGAIGVLEILRKLDSVLKAIEEHSKRIEELTKIAEGHSKSIEEHSRRLEEHSRRIGELTKIIEQHSKRLEELTKVVEQHSRRLEELTKLVEQHSRRLEELTKIVEGHSRRIEELGKVVEQHSRKLEELGKRIEELTKIIEQHSKRLEELTLALRDHGVRIDELSRRVSNLEVAVGALAESTYARYFYEDLLRELASRGEVVVRRVRNARVDEEDVDLLVETQLRVYVVEVKLKPKHEDVGRVLAKADVVRGYYPGKEVIGVLAGSMIGREVESYAREKGVEVYAY